MLLFSREKLNAQDCCHLPNHSDYELGKHNGDNTTKQSYTHLEIDVTFSEVRNEHDANHRKIHESNNCIVGLVLLLSHLGEHDLQRLIHNHEHEKQEVNGVVALSVIVLVLS